ncbi:speckle-type POZ protein [Parasteatoda tepidariorum]|uniref:speckle-type POZ protein n=1 Tax=Parasteatoda tepidariorum TaxID=114398 RepID=UPI00077F8457|nr:speckle-type POZ protein-like [Parasteatoda tepidariorum]
MDEFVFTWKIENFNLAVNKKGESVSSPEFINDSLEKTNWFLQIYPYGETDDTYIGLYLNRSQSDTGPTNIAINYTFSIVKADGSEEPYKMFENVNFTLSKRDGCKEFKRRDDIMKGIKIYLPKHTFTVRCYIQRCAATPSASKNKETVKNLAMFLFNEKTDSELPAEVYSVADGALKEVKDKICPFPNQCTARTRVRLEKRTFIWNIENFSQLKKNQKVFLPVISASKLTPSFLMTLYLADESASDQHIQIEIKKKKDFTSVSTIGYGGITVLKHKSRPSDFNCAIHFFEAQKNDPVWQFPPIIKRSKLLGEREEYLRNDTLSLKCQFALSDGATLHQIEDTSYWSAEIDDAEKELESLLNLREDFLSLSTDPKLSDITLMIGKEKFPAHKAVLSARSAVFKAMFERDMAEKESGVVKLTDLDADTLTRMLRFIYSGCVEDLNCEIAANLYSAADKYQCLNLKEECASFLKTNLSVANVCDVIYIADMHQDEDLKAAGCEFITLHGAETLRSEEWKMFLKNKTQLAAETLNNIGLRYMV